MMPYAHFVIKALTGNQGWVLVSAQDDVGGPTVAVARSILRPSDL